MDLCSLLPSSAADEKDDEGKELDIFLVCKWPSEHSSSVETSSWGSFEVCLQRDVQQPSASPHKSDRSAALTDIFPLFVPRRAKLKEKVDPPSSHTASEHNRWPDARHRRSQKYHSRSRPEEIQQTLLRSKNDSSLIYSVIIENQHAINSSTMH